MQETATKISWTHLLVRLYAINLYPHSAADGKPAFYVHMYKINTVSFWTAAGGEEWVAHVITAFTYVCLYVCHLLIPSLPEPGF